MIKKIYVSLLIVVCAVLQLSAQQERAVWSKEKANEWYATKGWLRGSNFIPSTAINQLEMWQQESFDPATIDRELGYAEPLWWANSTAERIMLPILARGSVLDHAIRGVKVILAELRD